MLGDEEAASAAKISTVNLLPRTFFEHDYCKNKRVSCIKFHPTKPYLVGMSMTENLSFDDRAEIAGKSFDSHVLIMNFSDAHIVTLNYVLETPIEVSTIEFHPDNPNVIIGGCISGQLIIWDLSCMESRITAGKKPEAIKMPDEEEDKSNPFPILTLLYSLANNCETEAAFPLKYRCIPQKLRRRSPVHSLWC